MTQQDVEKKERASASKASHSKKNSASSSAAKPQRKALAKRSKKAASPSDEAGYSSDSEEEDVPEENLPEDNTEEIQYDQKAILDNPAKSALSSMALLSPRRSPRHAVERTDDIPSAPAKPKMLSKTAAKRKKAFEEDEMPAKKAKKVIPETVDEPQEYDHMPFIDILDSVAYEAIPEAIESLRCHLMLSNWQ